MNSALLALLLLCVARPVPAADPGLAALMPPPAKFKPKVTVDAPPKSFTYTLLWTNPGPVNVKYSADLRSWQTILQTTNQSLVLTQPAPAYFKVFSEPQVTLAWDHSPDPTAIGYHIWVGSSNVSYPLDAGYTTRLTFRVEPATVFQFSATAYNSARLDGPNSASITYTSAPLVQIRARIQKQ